MVKRTSLLLLLAVAACARITQENYLLIDEGMSEREVNALLGTPTESLGY